jgi:UDP-N-acetylglucosamine--N-acetylmuramyl-(pentapeptide) pyrophosphoryl-undecaprenol N-acetylglucosamine transferase
MKEKNKYKFLFAGGGTGGHLFPAIAVAEKIREKRPQSDILFIGTKNKIESRVVPQLGFRFKSIWIKGFTRGSILQNILFPVRVLVSFVQSFFINLAFNPRVAIGSGGYVSGPAIYGAYVTGSKIFLIEQNSYPGMTTRMLEKYADEIHIAFEESRKYLKNKERIYLTGNPVRSNLSLINRNEALSKYNLKPGKRTILVLGGSLGARTINKSVEALLPFFERCKVQVIWQTGKNYYDAYRQYASENIFISEFIEDMNNAFSACDLVISRAGATTIAEIAVLGVPSILVPSPNVAENHQFYNAKYLADSGAAVLVEDKDAESSMEDILDDFLFNEEKLNQLRQNARKAGKKDAAEIIADRAIKIVEEV